MSDCAKHARERGFTIVELLVAMLLLTATAIGLYNLLDGSARVSKMQNQMADVGENLRFTVARLVRLVRMAGSGGLPLVAPGVGGAMQILAIDVTDNVPANAGGFGSSPRTALAGTDVLMIRGVMEGELFDLRGVADVVPLGATTYRVSIQPSSPFTGQPQLLVAPEAGTPILFTSSWESSITTASGQSRDFSRYNIGIVTGASVTASDPTAPMVIDVKTTSSSDAEQQILALNDGAAFPPFERQYVIAAGFLDDLVFFIANNDDGQPALFEYNRAFERAEELVPNISDLQVAVGCDTNADGVLTEIGAAADDDEWFFNAAGDNAPTPTDLVALQEVRLSVVARTASPDPEWVETGQPPENAPDLTAGQRRFRHRSVTVRVTIRSHPPLGPV